jgi:BioD-like phosphotransacetylase family protein
LVLRKVGTGLPPVLLSVVRALDQEGIHVVFYKPIYQPEAKSSSGNVNASDSDSDLEDNCEDVQERSTHFLSATGNFDPPEPFAYLFAEDALKSDEGLNLLLEGIIDFFEEAVKDRPANVVVVEGLMPNKPGIEMLNQKIA